jgi:hypothetical protein
VSAWVVIAIPCDVLYHVRGRVRTTKHTHGDCGNLVSMVGHVVRYEIIVSALSRRSLAISCGELCMQIRVESCASLVRIIGSASSGPYFDERTLAILAGLVVTVYFYSFPVYHVRVSYQPCRDGGSTNKNKNICASNNHGSEASRTDNLGNAKCTRLEEMERSKAVHKKNVRGRLH